jgi:predicted Zn-dependent protease
MRYVLVLVAALLCALSVQARDLKDILKELEKQTKPPAEQPKQEAKPTAEAPQGKPEAGPALPQIPPFGKVPVEDEIRIGQHIAGTLLGAAPLVDDAALQRYVNRVGRWVALQSERPDLPWTFGVIQSPDLNAFAAPGGYVFVTKGLYALLSDESELAGVLAHEIAHVTQRHHLKVMQQSQLIGAGSKLLTKKITGNERTRALLGSGAEIMARGLDKTAEFEADRMGVVLATRAGYDSYGLPAVLQEIGQVPQSASAVGLLFKTHPHPDERLSRLSEAMGSRFDGLRNPQSLPERFHALK